jgi:hypothetical protein
MRRKKEEFRAGAAEYNRIVHLLSRKQQVNNAIRRLEQNQQPLINTLQAAITSRRTATTNAQKQYFARQQARLHERIQPYANRMHALMNEHNALVLQIGQFLPPRFAHTAHFAASLNRMLGSRLAHAIETAYLRPGGMYTRRAFGNASNLARARTNASAHRRVSAARRIQKAWRVRVLKKKIFGN